MGSRDDHGWNGISYYRLAPGLSIFTEYEREQDFGELRNIRNTIGESTSEDRITLGFSLIF